MDFQIYDLVLVNFPYTDLSSVKKRPALVLNNLEGQNIIVCQITTKRHSLKKYEVFLKKDSCEGDIRFDSYIYLDLLATLHKNQIVKKIGRIKNVETKKEINNKLSLLLLDTQN